MLLSGSKWGLARCCLWSFRPDVEEIPRAFNKDANRGTQRHAVLEAMQEGKTEGHDLPDAWGCTEAEWPAIEANIREWMPPIGSAEVALYYDPMKDTARTDDAKSRAYDPSSGEIPMTVDFFRHIPGGVEVWDYKTGLQEHLEPAASNGQLAICCLAAARLAGVSSARGVLAIVADDGTARLDTVEYDSLDLESIAYEARGLVAMIPTSEPHPGTWCKDKWCAARAVCPKMQEAIVSTPMAPLSLTIDSPEVCARVHIQIGLAEEFLEAVKRARNTWLEENPAGCALADGLTLCMGIEERDSIELTPAAIAVLEEHHCADAIEPKTSKAAIERTIKATAAKGEASGKLRAVLEALDAAHAIRVSQFTKIKVRKGRKAA